MRLGGLPVVVRQLDGECGPEGVRPAASLIQTRIVFGQSRIPHSGYDDRAFP
jgi:hypothetical protein